MVENVKYEVIHEIGKAEIRQYPKMVIAAVENMENGAFNILYSFITGNNRQKLKIKMTAPVVSQQIAMTSPVLSDAGSLAFVMPKEYTLETTPEPTDNHVKISEIPSRMVAALCFSGNWSEKNFEAAKRELLGELTRAGTKTRGNVFAMLYNPPYIPGFLRRNEVAIEIEEP
jgi:effector-binding domain-containing protein